MKIKYLIISILGIVLFSSCQGDLDINQKSEVSANSMWKESSDAVSAMYGLYNKQRSTFSYDYLYWGEFRTGLWGESLCGNQKLNQVSQNQIPTDNGSANWENLYSTINHANLILKYTPNISFSTEEDKDKVLANAYYVRAFCYYWIGRIWGDAPLLLEGFESEQQENLYPVRVSADAIFKQVGIDIEKAIELMPTSVESRTTASLGSINMLKADYSLWMYKVRNAGDTYLQAADQANTRVLNMSLYSLEKKYSSIFRQELGPEIIFAWSYIQDEYTGGIAADFLVPSQYISPEYIENPVKVGSHQQWEFLTDEYQSFLSENKDDQRTVETFQSFYDDIKKGNYKWINKFSGTWINNTRVFNSDMIVYRYADAILFDAEIKMYEGDNVSAVVSLNKIAKRAYGVEHYYEASLSGNALNEAIISERMKEFAAEGKLWWDYVRMGVVFEKNKYLQGRENEQNVLLWPVSQTSINKNPSIIQTPGYDK